MESAVEEIPDTGVFRFRFKGQVRCCDPFEVRRRLNAANPKWSELVAHVASMRKPLPGGVKLPARDEQFDAAIADLAGCVTAAFGIPALGDDGAGATEAQRVRLLIAYLTWCRSVEEDTRPLASGPPSTGSAAVS